jgi:hypothetical protein
MFLFISGSRASAARELSSCFYEMRSGRWESDTMMISVDVLVVFCDTAAMASYSYHFRSLDLRCACVIFSTLQIAVRPLAVGSVSGFLLTV